MNHPKQWCNEADNEGTKEINKKPIEPTHQYFGENVLVYAIGYGCEKSHYSVGDNGQVRPYPIHFKTHKLPLIAGTVRRQRDDDKEEAGFYFFSGRFGCTYDPIQSSSSISQRLLMLMFLLAASSSSFPGRAFPIPTAIFVSFPFGSVDISTSDS
jgi:hypothetical protein